MDVSPEGVVYVTYTFDGLGVYSWESSTLTHLAQVDDGGLYYGVKAKADGIIYVACGYDGLRVYRFSGYVGTEDISSQPIIFALEQNYPNPFNPTTAISYQLSDDSQVELTIYDLAGKKIKTLINEYQSAGYHTVNWTASIFPSGIYLYSLIAGDFIETKKMLFMK